MNRRVVITGMGVVSPIGVGRSLFRKNLREGVSEEQVKNLLTISGGKVGLVMRLMRHPELLEDYVQMYAHVQSLSSDPHLVRRFTYIEQLIKKEDDQLIGQFLRLLAIHFRSFGVEQNQHQLKSVLDAHRLFKTTNVNRRLLLEELMLNV